MSAHLRSGPSNLPAQQGRTQRQRLAQVFPPMARHFGISGRRRLEQNQQADVMALGHELPGCLKCQDAAIAMTAQNVGPFWTHRPDRRAEQRRVLLHCVDSAIEQRTRVANNEEGLIRTGAFGQIQEVIRVFIRAGDTEEGDAVAIRLEREARRSPDGRTLD